MGFCFIAILTIKSQENEFPPIEQFHDGIHHWNLFHENRNYARYDEKDYVEIAGNLVEYQNSDGGWPKNIDWLAKLNPDSLKKTLSERDQSSTFDNDNVYPQIEYLAKVYSITGGKQLKSSILKGLDYIFAMQNASGGWRGWDVDAITYNDQIMSGIMNLLLDISQGKDCYSWLDKQYVLKSLVSLKKAIEVTLRCQIVVNGVKTAWCQQHDHNTLQPVKARSFELPSITSRESCDVIEFLMRIENPGDTIKDAINSAVVWLKLSAINGISLQKIKIDSAKIINKEYPYDLIVVQDSLAKPIWARFYDIQTNTPFMCRRDGRIVYNLSEVDPERRIGYAWYGYWPEETIRKYSEWLIKNNN